MFAYMNHNNVIFKEEHYVFQGCMNYEVLHIILIKNSTFNTKLPEQEMERYLRICDADCLHHVESVFGFLILNEDITIRFKYKL